MPEGLTGRACLPTDVVCDPPFIGPIEPDADSYLVFTLPHAWRGYSVVSAPGYVDSLIYSNRPFIEDNEMPTTTILTARSLRSIARGGNEEIDGTKGIA